MTSTRKRAGGSKPSSGTSGGNPGNAGPKGALDLPAARTRKRGRDVDRNEQRNFVTLSETERKKSRRDGTN
jgi:hypothetical protein